MDCRSVLQEIRVTNAMSKQIYSVWKSDSTKCQDSSVSNISGDACF